MVRPGIEPATLRSRAELPNHYTIATTVNFRTGFLLLHINHKKSIKKILRVKFKQKLRLPAA